MGTVDRAGEWLAMWHAVGVMVCVDAGELSLVRIVCSLLYRTYLVEHRLWWL